MHSGLKAHSSDGKLHKLVVTRFRQLAKTLPRINPIGDCNEYEKQLKEWILGDATQMIANGV